MTDPSVPTAAYKDAEWCRSRYFDDGKTLREIAAEVGIHNSTLGKWFKKHGIELPASHEKREQRGNTQRGEKSSTWKGGRPKCACGKPIHYDVTECIDCYNERPRHGEHSPRWSGDGIGYVGAHERVKAIHGPAAEHDCRHCGKTAAHWAYDHTDPNELHNPDGSPYSSDPSKYMPLCKSCHMRFDDAHRKNTTGKARHHKKPTGKAAV